MKTRSIKCEIVKNCSCKNKGIIPAQSLCGNGKNLRDKMKEMGTNSLYVAWENDPTLIWMEEKFNFSTNYYGEILKPYMEEYDDWLVNSQVQDILKPNKARQVTLTEIQDIKNNYLNTIYQEKFELFSYDNYLKNYSYITNPYIGYYLENLYILVCLELPWKTKILPYVMCKNHKFVEMASRKLFCATK